MANKNLIERFQRSTTELFALSILAGRDSYPYRLTVDIRKQTFGLIDYSIGGMYPVFARLLSADMISSYTVESTDGKDPRTLYHIEPKGLKYLVELKNEYDRFVRVTQLITESDGCWKADADYTVNRDIIERFQRSTTELFALSILIEGDSHPYRLTTAIRKRTLGLIDYSIAGMYPTFSRLLKGGQISSYTVVETSDKRESKTWYHIEDEGRKYLSKLKDEFDRFVRVSYLITESNGFSMQKEPD